MTTSSEMTKKSVQSSINELVEEFQRQPYRYLFESDLQASLYAKLCFHLPETIKVSGTGKPENEYTTTTVHTEYWKKIDIVCLDQASKNLSKKREHMGSDIHLYELPVLVGIELKFLKMGDIFNLLSCVKDFEKLRGFNIPYPISLGFIQHHSYEDSFFSIGSNKHSLTEVQEIIPFNEIHIISPWKVWRVSFIASNNFDSIKAEKP